MTGPTVYQIVGVRFFTVIPDHNIDIDRVPVDKSTQISEFNANR